MSLAAKYAWLKPGTRVQLWPGDTYGKYAVVQEVNCNGVIFKITAVDQGELHYRPGELVTLPWTHIFLRSL